MSELRALVGANAGVDPSSYEANAARSPGVDNATAPNLNTARVLATLRGAAPNANPTYPTTSPAASGGGSVGGGFGTDLAAGLNAAKPGMSAGNSFLAGFAGATKSVDDRHAAAVKAASDSQKANMDLLKSMFDMSSKVQQADRQAQQDQASSDQQDVTNARAAAQDAETKRWHDIMAPSYAAKGGTGNWDDLSVRDQSLAAKDFAARAGIPDLSKSDGNAAWSLLPAEEQDRRIGILSNLQPTLAYKLFPDRAPKPPPGKGAAAAPEDDDGGYTDGPATAAPPAAPVTPAAPPRQGGFLSGLLGGPDAATGGGTMPATAAPAPPGTTSAAAPASSVRPTAPPPAPAAPAAAAVPPGGAPPGAGAPPAGAPPAPAPGGGTPGRFRPVTNQQTGQRFMYDTVTKEMMPMPGSAGAPAPGG